MRKEKEKEAVMLGVDFTGPHVSGCSFKVGRVQIGPSQAESKPCKNAIYVPLDKTLEEWHVEISPFVVTNKNLRSTWYMIRIRSCCNNTAGGTALGSA
jgi:hypothetical protein